MNEKEIIAECYKEMYHGMIDKDRSLLSRVLDESFALVHMTWMRQSKEAFIRAVEDGTLNYFSAGHQSIDVSIEDESASLVGKSLVNAAVFGGGRHTWRLQLKLKLVKKSDDWKITEAKASVY